MKALYRFSDSLIKIGAYIAGIFIVLATLMTFYEVISRWLFNKPTIFATELSTYAIIGSCFLGSAYAIRTYAHITVDLLINNVNDKLKKLLGYLSNFMGLVFSIIFTFFVLHHVLNTKELGVTSSSLLRVPMYIPELLLPLGGLLMCLAFILQIIDGDIHRGGDHI